jgi:hypothetical protein
MDERKKMRLTQAELEEKERLMRKKRLPGEIRQGRPVPEEFWRLPRPEDPEGLLLKALLDDRRQGR